MGFALFFLTINIQHSACGAFEKLPYAPFHIPNDRKERLMNTILIIDDDRELCALIKKCLEQEHFLCTDCTHRGIGT